MDLPYSCPATLLCVQKLVPSRTRKICSATSRLGLTLKLNLRHSHINPLPPTARALNKICEIYDRNHQAYKNATEVKQNLLERRVCKASVYFGHSTTSVSWACCHNSRLCLPPAAKPSASKGVTKVMVVTSTCIAQHVASKKTWQRWYVQVPAKKQEKTEEEQPSLSRDTWDNLLLKTSSTPTTSVPCVCSVACTSSIPQSWPQHR